MAATLSRIKFLCPACSRVCRVPGSFAGRLGRCPACRVALEVPRPSRGSTRKEKKAVVEDGFELLSEDECSSLNAAPPLGDLADEPEFDPNDYQVNPTLQGYGAAIAGLNLLFGIVLLRAFGEGIMEGAGDLGFVLAGLGSLGLAALLVVLGLGLRKGDWRAVLGLTFVWPLGVVLNLSVAEGTPIQIVLRVGLCTLLYLPPLVIGFRERHVLRQPLRFQPAR